MSVWNRKSTEAPPPPPEISRPPQPPQERSAPKEHVRQGATIGQSMVIKGELRGHEDMYLDGELEGKLDLNRHRLTIGPNGKVRASVRAREVEIQGTLQGNVEAAGRIIIRKNAKLVGDLKMAGIVIEDGAYFKGNIDITPPQAAKPAAESASARAAT